MVLVCKVILQDHMTNLVKGIHYPTKVGGHNHSGSGDECFVKCFPKMK